MNHTKESLVAKFEFKKMAEYKQPMEGAPLKREKTKDEMQQLKRETAALEKQFLEHIEKCKAYPGVDPRWVAICKTHIEEGCMALNKAIFSSMGT